MGDNSSIGWTRGEDGKPGSTWNPFRAELIDPASGRPRRGWFCEKVSTGCDGCYAEDWNGFRGNGLDYEANAFELIDRTPTEVRLRDRRRPESTVRLYIDVKTLLDPIRWQRPRKIFPCSMTDYCLRFYPDEWIEALFAVAALARRHTFQFLTKRATRQRELLSRLSASGNAIAIRSRCYSILYDIASEETKLIDRAYRKLEQDCVTTEDVAFPPRNAWIGVSIEDEKAFWRAEQLGQTPAALRWWSVEPFVGRYSASLRGRFRLNMYSGAVDWIVPGGESGTRARSLFLTDLSDMIADCREYEIPIFIKQVGARPVFGSSGRRLFVTGKGEDVSEWPRALRVQEFPKRESVAPMTEKDVRDAVRILRVRLLFVDGPKAKALVYDAIWRLYERLR